MIRECRFMSEAKSLSLIGGSVILRLFCLLCLVRCIFSPESFINADFSQTFFVSLRENSNNQGNTRSPRMTFKAIVLSCPSRSRHLVDCWSPQFTNNNIYKTMICKTVKPKSGNPHSRDSGLATKIYFHKIQIGGCDSRIFVLSLHSGIIVK